MGSKRRTGFSRYLERMTDATEDFVDDLLDRADDVECDVRHSLSKALECDYDDDDWDDEDDDWHDRDSRHGRSRSGRDTRHGAGGGNRRKSRSGKRPAPAPAPAPANDLEGIRSELAALTERIEGLSSSRA